MNVKVLPIAAALFAASQTANADTLSFAIGGGVWNADPSGDISSTLDPAGTPAVDVKSNLFWDEESQGYLYATLEHPVPLLPNVRLSTVTLDYDGSGTTTFDFENVTYTGTVTSDISIDQTDLLLYYELLDNVVSFDLGLSIRSVDLDYNITDGTNTTRDSVSETIPLVYGMIGGSPWPDLLFSVEGSIISYDGNKLSDIMVKVSYTTNFLLGFDAGYRTQTLELDDVDDINSELDFDGLFVGAHIKF